MAQYRYPGVKPFETLDAGQYFGRQREIQDLYDLILLEKLVVLFGKSGYGKSSLLNAGIIPKLTDANEPAHRRFTPVVIKFASYTTRTAHSPVSAVQDHLLRQFGKPVRPKQWPFPFATDSLWLLFKQYTNANPGRHVVLIFDQFEEFFTYPLEQQVQFSEQLAELLYTEVPQTIRDNWETLSDPEKEFLAEDIHVHTVLAIREDRLSWLNSLKGDLPAILNKRFELKGLTDEQAKEAIVKPALLPQGNDFSCHAFQYSPEALEFLLAELKKSGTDIYDHHHRQRGIEAFLLQICCESIERRLIERAKKKDRDELVSREDLPRFDRIYEEYYNNKINEIPEIQRATAKRLIEDELIGFNEATGVTFRLNADGRKLLTHEGVDEALLKKLVDCFLLRTEPNTTGGFNYEISHDTLLMPVLKAKEIRLAEERRELEAGEKLKREKEIAEERKKRRRANIVAALGVLLALIAAGASYFAYQARDLAQKAEREAIDALEKARIAQQISETRLKELQREQARALIIRGDDFQRYGQHSDALYEYEQALKLTPEDENLIRLIEQCKRLINTQNHK